MSNVLIGIIGVILFIGLALAGALILGDDFKSSNAASRAAGLTSRTQQTAAAIEMYQLKTGQMVTKNVDMSIDFLVPRFVKSTNTDTRVFSWNGTTRGVAWIYLPDDSQTSVDICGEIQRQNGQIGPNDAVNVSDSLLFSASANTTTGCIRNGNRADGARLAVFSRF